MDRGCRRIKDGMCEYAATARAWSGTGCARASGDAPGSVEFAPGCWIEPHALLVLVPEAPAGGRPCAWHSGVVRRADVRPGRPGALVVVGRRAWLCQRHK